MVSLEIQAQVGSVSSTHLEDFSTSLRNGFTSQRRKPPCLRHPEPTPIFDFKLQIRPTPAELDPMSLSAQSASSLSTYIQPGLQLSSCHHAQHVKACRRQHFAVHSRRNCYNHDSPPKWGHNQPTRFHHTVIRFSLHYPMQLYPTLGKATHFYKSCLKRKSAAFENLMTNTFESRRT